MLLLDRLQEILILHRKLDYDDEDATLEEQGEKILYFFSSSLDSRDVREQLGIATLAEALIALTTKFSKEPIQTVVMHRKFWTFMECEPDIWIIVAFLNNSEAITSAKFNPNNITSDQVISTDVYHSFLKDFYSLYYTMNGSLQSFLLGSEEKGLEVIDDIMLTQRKIRKLRKRITIKEGDIRTAEMDKDAFVPESTESMEDLNNDLSVVHKKLSELLSHPSFTLPTLRAKLSNYIQWYLYQENINNISVFSSVRKLVSSVEDRKEKYCVSAVTNLINSVKTALPDLSMKFVLSFENKLLWSDVDNALTNHLLEFFYRCDHTIKLGSTNRRVRLATEEFAKSLFQENRCEYPLFDSHMKEKLFYALKSKEMRIQSRYGAFLINGQTVNLDSFLTVLNPSSLNLPNQTKSNSINGDGITGPTDETELLARILSSDGFRFDDKTALYHPRIHLPSSTANPASCSGRLLHFFFGKLSLSCIIEENNNYHQYKQERIQSLIEQPPISIVARRIKLSLLHDLIYGPNAATDTNNNPSSEIVDAKDVKRVQLLLLSYVIQKAVRCQLEKVEGNDWNKYFFSNASNPITGSNNSSSSAGGGNAGTNNASNALSPRAFQSISTASTSSSTSSNTANIASAVVTASAANPMATNNAQAIATSAIGGAAGMSEYVNPTTIRGLIQPKASNERDCKVFYFTSTYAGIKLYDKDTGDVLLPLFLAPDLNNDLRTIIANTVNAAPNSMNNMIPNSKTIDSVLDQYFYHQQSKGPFSAIFFQCLTNCFGIIAMKVLIDIWQELEGEKDQAKEKEDKESNGSASEMKSSSSSSDGNRNKKLRASRQKKFVVTRVSAPQRGGVWIVGKRLFTGQCLYLVLSQCANLYDVMDMLDKVIRDITKK